ncbi:MAG TPA: hypothetical protein VFC99_05695 [Acidimicrobiia bacterium]|nr:hypothetical protein [Acidimicrobiia bacterium]
MALAPVTDYLVDTDTNTLVAKDDVVRYLTTHKGVSVADAQAEAAQVAPDVTQNPVAPAPSDTPAVPAAPAVPDDTLAADVHDVVAGVSALTADQRAQLLAALQAAEGAPEVAPAAVPPEDGGTSSAS